MTTKSAFLVRVRDLVERVRCSHGYVGFDDVRELKVLEQEWSEVETALAGIIDDLMAGRYHEHNVRASVARHHRETTPGGLSGVWQQEQQEKRVQKECVA